MNIIPRLERGEFQTYDDARRALWTQAVQIEPELRNLAQGGGSP